MSEYTERKYAHPGQEARHLCGNAKCNNPAHLKLGSNTENSLEKRLHGTSGKKLNIQKVEEMRASNDSVEELAKRFEVSLNHVKKILKNTSWKV